MKNIRFLLLFINILFLFGCGKESGSGQTKSNLILSEHPDITLTLTNISPNGAIVTIYNGSTGSISYGSEYKFVLEKQIDGIWYVCERANRTADGHHITTTDIEYVLESGMTDESEISWDFLYGDLPAGKYRFIKEIQNEPAPFPLTGNNIAVEFEILPITSS